MKSLSESEPILHASGDEPDLDRAPTSRWAVASTVLGVLSVVALTTPLLVILPGMAAVAGLLGLRAVAVSEGELRGRRWAIVGLTLAALFGVWSPTYTITRNNVLYSLAEPRAREWLDLMAHGQVRLAHQLRLPPFERAAEDENLEDYYGLQSHSEYIRSFLSEATIKRVSEVGPDAQFRLIANLRVVNEGENDDITQRYEITPTPNPSGKNNEPFRVDITMRRLGFRSTGESRWQMSECQPSPLGQ